jgi:hypothetical protein
VFSKNKYLLILINLFIGLVQFGCFDKPNEFVAPVWDAEINIPITSKQFELRELVEKDSALLKAYDDPELLGLLYFGDIQPISSISINDDLKLDGIETGFSESLGQIKVKIRIPVASEIRVEDWTTEVTSGSFQIFPEQEGTVSIDVAGVESVESILADEGNLSLFIVNRLPVEIVLRGISIKNGIDGSVIAERSGSNPAQWLAIPPLSFDSVSFPVDGKVITNSLLYEGTIWSQGSNGEAVQIPEEAGTTILALFQDLVIGEATAALPVQDFGFSGEIKLDDSTKIREAVIEDGRGKITIDNNIDLNVAINVVFENLIDPDNQQYNFEIFLQKNEKNRVVDLPSLKGWRIVTLTPGVGTNYLIYNINALTDSTG